MRNLFILTICFFSASESISQTDLTLNIKSEQSIRNYFDENGSESVEGIWEFSSYDGAYYRIAFIKKGYEFHGTILESNKLLWKPGDLKVTIEETASDEIFSLRWVKSNKLKTIKCIGRLKDNMSISFTPQFVTLYLYRIYPKKNAESKRSNNNTSVWLGNGSGVIISKSGYIITNYHVIEDSEEIEVEFIVDDEVKNFNASIVQVDKVNDLAIIKIFDMNFDGVSDLPYNFKSTGCDVGTKVYAYGYPMALSVMGKEVKVTDGIISSKTGFDGDITTYQITAPIQGGNSGGPLFDDQGNLIGINSSGLSKDIADNVGYSIKSSYILNLLDVLPNNIDLPASTSLSSLTLTEQVKEISKFVVLIKVK